MLGTVAASLFAGFICTIDFNNGWPLIFYIYGTSIAFTREWIKHWTKLKHTRFHLFRVVDSVACFGLQFTFKTSAHFNGWTPLHRIVDWTKCLQEGSTKTSKKFITFRKNLSEISRSLEINCYLSACLGDHCGTRQQSRSSVERWFTVRCCSDHW